ncbi:MAG TPA: SLC13 family permease [Verrucomicrobiae bacterium]|jgi:arsenical pump membrane protein|nr:SLC13 family permease [Verrucomicrobiae bacterium]
MIPAAAAPALLCFIVAVSILLMLIRPRGIAEVYWIGTGVILLLVLRLISLRLAKLGALKSLDVCLFLIGMMLLSEVAREHGVFDWLSATAVQRADGSRLRLFTLVYGVGVIVTVFLSNDATAVVLTPAILVAVRKAKVEPLPYLFACAFIANAASFLLPISNPANLVVFHSGMPPLGRWLQAFAVPCLLSIVSTYWVMRWIFRHELSGKIQNHAEPRPLNGNGRFVVGGVGLVVIVLLTVSSFGKDLGLPTCLAAMTITAVVSVKERTNPLLLAREISWETLALVAGLFIMVDAMESIGAMNYTQAWLASVERLGLTAAWFSTGFVVGVANNLVNNLPLGLIAGGTLHAAHGTASIGYPVLIAVDLGPNLSITGSLATILWLIALRKEKLDVTFWDFLKVGVVAMPVALLVSLSAAVLIQKILVP